MNPRDITIHARGDLVPKVLEAVKVLPIEFLSPKTRDIKLEATTFDEKAEIPVWVYPSNKGEVVQWEVPADIPHLPADPVIGSHFLYQGKSYFCFNRRSELTEIL